MSAGASEGVSPQASWAGARLGPSRWRLLEQSDIDAFARITRDRQWIHVDPERARRESPFGTTVAHGTLLLALLDGFRDELTLGKHPPLAVAAGWDRVRLLTPVPAGSRVRASVEVSSVEPVAGGGWRIGEAWTLELEHAARPALVASAIGRVLS